MGAVEDVLRARIEAKKADEAKDLEEFQQRMISDLHTEIITTITWLEGNNWPGGELRFWEYGGEEERAMWQLTNPISQTSTRDGLYLDSLGNLILFSGYDIVLWNDDTLQHAHPGVLLNTVKAVRAIRSLYW